MRGLRTISQTAAFTYTKGDRSLRDINAEITQRRIIRIKYLTPISYVIRIETLLFRFTLTIDAQYCVG